MLTKILFVGLYLYKILKRLKIRHLILTCFALQFGLLCLSQTPSCPSPFVYMDGPGGIHAYNPTQPLSATNPSPIGIPNGGGGLTLMPNINGGTLSPTFYSIIGGNYSYWDGAAWVSTGHGTGSGAAVNLGGCGSKIYNLVGASGQVWVYNGTATGTLLTTIAGFNGGGPYDLVTDCNCNFYVLNTTTPNQNLTLYSQAGTVLCSYSLSGMPNATAGGGFAIIGNTIVVKNNLTNGFYVGTISGPTVTFTNIVGFGLSPGDFASCPVCIPSATLNSASISGGALGCTIPTINVIANTTATPVTYNWSGPGIIGPNTNSAIVVNSTGIYTVVITASGCPAAQLTLTTTIVTSAFPVFASITPSGNICTDGLSSIPLYVSSSTSNSMVTWTGPGIIGPVNGPSVSALAPGVYSVLVTDLFTGCAGASTVNIVQNPTVSLSLSSQSMCAQPFLSSPATISISPFGASNYTFLPGSGYSVSVAGPTFTFNPNLIICWPVAPFSNSLSVVSGTLIGSNFSCIDSTTTTFSIFPNPSIAISPPNSSMCIGGNMLLLANGATNYTWSSVPGLSNYTQNVTLATPSITSVYSLTGSSDGCFALPATATVNVLPLPSFSVNPSSTLICLGTQAAFAASGNAGSYNWFPPIGLSSPTGPLVLASPLVSTQYTVIASLNSCTSLATVTLSIQNPPTLSLSVSDFSMCAQNTNGSTNSIQATPSGASNYTLLTGFNFSVTNPNGPVMTVVSSGPPQPILSLATLTLNGKTGVCNVNVTQTVVIVPNPSVSVVPSNTAICPGMSQVFVASGASNYAWMPASNLNTYSGSIVVSVTPTVPSMYSIVGESAGCFSATRNANLFLLPIPSVLVNPYTSTICIGKSITLQASGSASSYSWQPSVGLSVTSGTAVTASPPSTQEYTITGSLNNCTNTALATVSTIAVPVISAAASDKTICSGASTFLQATGANSFSWSPQGTLNQGAGANVIASPLVYTSYTVRGFNGTCTGSTTVQVDIIPNPNMVITSSQNQVCMGYSLPLSVSGAQTYSWAPFSGLSATTGSLVHASPVASTNYSVYGSNSNGTVSCYQVLSYSVLVTPFAQPVVSNSVALCEGEKATLLASGGNTYFWLPTTGLNINNQQGVVASPSVSTIYTVDVSYNTFCGNTATVYVEVNPKPIVFAGRDTTYNIDEEIVISASGTGTLTWISGENITCAQCPFTRVYPTRDECYTIETVNAYGCKVQDQVCIDITNDFSIYIPNAFTPNKDGLNDVFLVVGTSLSAVKLEIFDRWGALLFAGTDVMQGWDGTYKGTDCALGVYIYRVEYTGLNGKRYIKTGELLLSK